MTNAEFALFYKKYHEFSRKIARKFIQDEHTLEDICQDVFTSIYNMGEELDLSNEKKIHGLVKTVTLNKVKDCFKRAHRRYECNVADLTNEEIFKRISYEMDDIILGIEARNNIKFIFRKLREKDEENYEIYVRVKIFGISPAFVAEQFHLTVSGVNNRNMRTKRWLKEEYLKLSE